MYAGYTKTQLTLYNKDNGGYSDFVFWTSSEGNDDKGSIFRIMAQNGVIGFFGIDPMQNKTTKYLVRPVLAK